MIGIYDYTVILTYANAVLGIMGMYLALNDNLPGAILLLVLAGICDLFDGAVANTKKNRTDEEKCYGIQIDSFADLISFCVFPTVIGYSIGFTDSKAAYIYAFFVLAGLIRLAYYNVSEIERKKSDSESRKYYVGLPVTTVSFIIPFVYFMSLKMNFEFKSVYLIMISIIGLMFITKIKIKKLSVSKLVNIFTKEDLEEELLLVDDINNDSNL